MAVLICILVISNSYFHRDWGIETWRLDIPVAVCLKLVTAHRKAASLPPVNDKKTYKARDSQKLTGQTIKCRLWTILPAVGHIQQSCLAGYSNGKRPEWVQLNINSTNSHQGPYSTLHLRIPFSKFNQTLWARIAQSV